MPGLATRAFTAPEPCENECVQARVGIRAHPVRCEVLLVGTGGRVMSMWSGPVRPAVRCDVRVCGEVCGM